MTGRTNRVQTSAFRTLTIAAQMADSSTIEARSLETNVFLDATRKFRITGLCNQNDSPSTFPRRLLNIFTGELDLY